MGNIPPSNPIGNTDFPIVLDASNLLHYFSQPGPSGIARIDIEYARALLAREGDISFLHQYGPFGTMLSHRRMHSLLDCLFQQWNESEDHSLEREVLDWLSENRPSTRRLSASTSSRRSGASALASLAAGWLVGPSARHMAEGSTYLNLSYAGLMQATSLRLLRARSDLFPVFMVHDLITLDHPDLFWDGALDGFTRKMDAVLEFGRLIVVPSTDVRDRFNNSGHTKRPCQPANRGHTISGCTGIPGKAV